MMHMCGWHPLLCGMAWITCLRRIVSATDVRKYDDPPGLQDNGEIVLNFLAGQEAV